LNKIIKLLILGGCILLHMSCKENNENLRIPLEAEVIEIFSNEVFIEGFKNLTEEMKTNYCNGIYIISGEIDFITWPKDGKDLIHTAIEIGVDDYNRNTLEGDCINIELDERRLDLKVGDKIKVIAQFDHYTNSQYGFFISLKHGRIINNLLDSNPTNNN